jgi:hypothetical protein
MADQKDLMKAVQTAEHLVAWKVVWMAEWKVD